LTYFARQCECKGVIVIEKFRSLRRTSLTQGLRVIGKTNGFLREEQGATMVEYGLMVALIAIVCIAAITTIGTNLNQVFSDIADSL
jgi:pilus assembly protein Flp/PilA